jgi:anaerobic magnesium-protoporphyrin IX monomethyl ester cyclase
MDGSEKKDFKKNMDHYTILLVNPPFNEKIKPGEGRWVSVGITLVGTLLKKAGYSVRLLDGALDANYYDEYLEILQNWQLNFIGFSVMTSQVSWAYEMSKQAKKIKPNIKIVWGGFHPTIFPEQTAADPNIDFVVVGEAVNIIVPLTEYILQNNLGHNKNIKSVPGIYYKENAEIKFTEKAPLADFDQIPDIDWTLYDRDCLERAMETNHLGMKVRSLPILTGLGCNNRCTFCFNTIYKIPHRKMPAERVYNNMKYLKETYNLEEITFYDENFFADKDRILNLIELLEKDPLDLNFFSSMRASDIRKQYFRGDFFQRLRRVGGYNFGIGAESGNQHILNKLKKGIRVKDIEAIAQLGSENDLILTFSFITGIPEEKPDEVFDTIDLISKIITIDGRHTIIGPQIFRPYPGSELFNEVVSKGYSIPNDLEGWTKNNVLSRLSVVNKETLPWIIDIDKFERILRTYNVQSYVVDIEGLKNMFFWSFYGHINRFLKNIYFRYFLKKVSDKFVTSMLNICKWRLKNRNVRFMIEMPAIKYLESLYFDKD